jgi:hypothetical protein
VAGGFGQPLLFGACYRLQPGTEPLISTKSHLHDDQHPGVDHDQIQLSEPAGIIACDQLQPVGLQMGKRGIFGPGAEVGLQRGYLAADTGVRVVPRTTPQGS